MLGLHYKNGKDPACSNKSKTPPHPQTCKVHFPSQFKRFVSADGLTEECKKYMIKDLKLIKIFDVDAKVEIN